VHDLEEAKAAAVAGTDYCGVGTMFATTLKPELKITGPAFLKTFIKQHPNIPHLAIGGVTPANMHLIVEAGGRGVAMSSAICAADDPAGVVRRIVEALPTN
jgi:thiamine-phosphate diphosphorylase